MDKKQLPPTTGWSGHQMSKNGNGWCNVPSYHFQRPCHNLQQNYTPQNLIDFETTHFMDSQW